MPENIIFTFDYTSSKTATALSLKTVFFLLYVPYHLTQPRSLIHDPRLPIRLAREQDRARNGGTSFERLGELGRRLFFRSPRFQFFIFVQRTRMLLATGSVLLLLSLSFGNGAHGAAHHSASFTSSPLSLLRFILSSFFFLVHRSRERTGGPMAEAPWYPESSTLSS